MTVAEGIIKAERDEQRAIDIQNLMDCRRELRECKDKAKALKREFNVLDSDVEKINRKMAVQRELVSSRLAQEFPTDEEIKLWESERAAAKKKLAELRAEILTAQANRERKRMEILRENGRYSQLQFTERNFAGKLKKDYGVNEDGVLSL